MNRRLFLKYTAGAITAAGAGCFVYAIGVEPHWLELVERDLPISNLPATLERARMVHISDLHIGPSVSDSYIVESLERVRAFNPDIVVVTGDFISYRQRDADSLFARVRSVLGHIPRGRLATLGILGNHDYGYGWRDATVAARVAAEAERAGVRVLRNETESVAGLDIIGVDDLWAGRADPALALRSRRSAAGLVLVHNPDAADQLPWADYSGWMLAGHTHGGQCKPPFLPPPLLPVQNRRYTAGAIRVDEHRSLYISRGVGHLLEARFNVRPEITVFTLQASRKLS